MNLLDAYVVKVNGQPYEKYGKFWVDVDYECWGKVSNQQLMFDDIAKANAVCIGYEFLT